MAAPNNPAHIQNLLKSGISLEALNFGCAKVVNSQGQVVQTIPLKSLAGLQKVVTVPAGSTQGTTTARFVSSPVAIAGTSGAQPQQIQFIQTSSGGFTLPSGNAVTVLSQPGLIQTSAGTIIAGGKPVTLSPALRNVTFAVKLATTSSPMQPGTVLTTTAAGSFAGGSKQQGVVISGLQPSNDVFTSPGMSKVVSSGSSILDRAMAAMDATPSTSAGPSRASKSPAKSGGKKAPPTPKVEQQPSNTKKKRDLDDSFEGPDAKRQKQDKQNTKGLRHFSMRVCQKVQKKKTTTYNEVADELVVELSDPSLSNVDQKNIRRRVYDALNVLMAMGMIAKEKKEIRWLGLPSCSDNSYKKLLEEKENLMRANLQKRQTLYELLLQIICFKNLVAKNKERTSKENVLGEGSSGNPEIPDTIFPSTKNRLPIPFLVISAPKETVIDCNVSPDRSEYLLSFSDAFELSDDFVVLKQMGMANGLENCNATDEQIQSALAHIPPAFHQILREIGKAPPVPPELLAQAAEVAGSGSTEDGNEDEEDIATYQGVTPSPPPGEYFEENEKMNSGWWAKSGSHAYEGEEDDDSNM